MDNYIQLIVLVFAALAVLIPLGVKLYKTINEIVQEKQWDRLMSLVISYMIEAENLMVNGEDKKKYVLSLISNTAQQVGYEIKDGDMEKISQLIDEICSATKLINLDSKEQQE